MASGKEIKHRIKSIGNTRQITKAMEMVAASKMRKSQENANALAPYSLEALRILGELSERMSGLRTHPLMEKPKRKNALLFVLTSDKGLCGGYNASIIKKAVDYADYLKKEGTNVEIMTLGRKGAQALAKLGYNLTVDFSDQVPENPKSYETRQITKIMIKGFMKKKHDRVYFIYNRFVSTVTQTPTIRRLVPLGKDALHALVDEAAERKQDRYDYYYEFEPSAQVLFDQLLIRLIETQVYEVVLSSIASEHSARMMAMRNATDAAGDIMDSLTLSYNKARQAQITAEIAEVSSGAAALNS